MSQGNNTLPPEVPAEREGLYENDVRLRVDALLQNAARTLAARDLSPALRNKLAENEIRLVLRLLDDDGVPPAMREQVMQRLAELGVEPNGKVRGPRPASLGAG